MAHVLISFLGKAANGYRSANYVFSDGVVRSTNYFGLALQAHLKPDTLVILGTPGSMWDVLIENMQGIDSDDELVEERTVLMDAAQQGAVQQEGFQGDFFLRSASTRAVET